jgi:hypothetical protein
MLFDKVVNIYTAMVLGFFVFGFGLIVFATRGGTRLGTRPVAFNSTKLGLDIKTDAVGLLVVLGVALIALAPFFLYRGYETRLAELQDQLSQANATSKELVNQLNRFKIYDAKLNLAFPRDAGVDPRKLAVQIAVTRPGETPKLFPAEKEIGPSDLWVVLNHVGAGDKVVVIATDSTGKSWQSDEIEIPKTQIFMRNVSR